MAAAIITTVRPPEPADTRRRAIIDFKPSTSYPAGGEPLTPGMFGFDTVIDHVDPAGDSSTTTLIVVWDSVNKRLRLYTASTGAEVGTASDQSAKNLRLMGLGI
jgi:hypothetical protein